MNWTRTDAARRVIVVTGLLLGPVLLVLSVAINLTAPGESMRADFDAMAARPGLIVAEALLETIGFTIVLASVAGAAHALRSRGGALGTWGAVLAVLGIVGFSFSNANGFTLAELAQLPDRDAAFATATSLMSSDISGIVGTVGTVLEMLGQIGILLVIAGLIRARIMPIWTIVIVIVGAAVNAVLGTMIGTLIADVLLLAVCALAAVRLARGSREAWLGMASAPASARTASPRAARADRRTAVLISAPTRGKPSRPWISGHGSAGVDQRARGGATDSRCTR
ncbi:hypothetical protein L2X99_12275 [Microbacterium sp. KUDC0406]|uniref:hypothetical protein n=1 Tax=Microbacterium sp. KUDC0406 TaxID=2909588 RepID=UPI001F1956C7|nr:hypothetical protein [Microbacterium sp. KUDC0406]UJP09214.1 hypothetical protein L2X99_12275 [Microbacterium sp. KUDC0406]